MNPERLAVVLRPRNAWEATDLGLRLAQRCARPLFAVSFVLTLLTVAISYLLIGVWLEAPDWALLLPWWLKPALDRALLHVLSRTVFDDTPDLRGTLRALPGVWRHSGLFAALSWARLDPHRAIRLPVAQLEGLRGAPARERRRLLPRRVSGTSLGLLMAFANFELLALGGIIVLLGILVPGEVNLIPPPLQLAFSPEVEPSWWTKLLWASCYALAVAFIEPFYIAAGFGLYLKRRTDLEAWDVELQLRRLQPTALAVLPVLLCGLLLAFAMHMPEARAEAPQSHRETAIKEAPQAIRKVLEAPEFGQSQTRRTLRWKVTEKKDDEPPSERFKLLLDALRRAGQFIAEFGRVIAWGALAVAVMVLLRVLLRHLGQLKLARRGLRPPGEIAGLDIRPESLPADVAASARALLAQGLVRDALALLYRAALSRLAHQHGVAFAPGDTEGDCLLRVTRAGLAPRRYFGELTQAWQSVAYARRPPPTEQLESLCARWTAALGTQP